jgi:hypothetical protein
MNKLFIIIAIFFLSVSFAFSQSLKSISNNKYLFSKDSLHTNISASILTKNNDIVKSEKPGDYITFSSGFFVPTKNNSSHNNLIFYSSFDLNINLGSVIYLDLGADVIFPKKEINLGLHGTLGVGFDIIPNKLFTHTGLGAIFIVPFVLTEYVTLRVNYKFTKDISAGLDNKLIGLGESSELIAYRYIIGANFSYRFNY